MKVENPNARQFYLDECVKSNWSTRQLDRQINSFSMSACYQRRAPPANRRLREKHKGSNLAFHRPI
ncbi:MAG: hypothetical protein LBU43_02980 [Candidatus Accumulibacter sp.]|jgi:predicted nuclease of restriction endonuclease-like (RecB) superfamily|nr:hypothetical protein [Accumulibacter sp.]